MNHDRLVVAEYYQSSLNSGTTSSKTEYFIVPAGSSSYHLGYSFHQYEEEGYGIIRIKDDTYYKLYHF